jgi:hypothetical protein
MPLYDATLPIREGMLVSCPANKLTYLFDLSED